MTRTLILGLAASTIVFLSRYGGMVSLAQLSDRRRRRVRRSATASPRAARRASSSGWNPWVAVVRALVDHHGRRRSVLGALSSRTYGIYFLMLTLTYAVIGYYVFGQVDDDLGLRRHHRHRPAGASSTAPGAAVLRRRSCSRWLAYVGFRAIVRARRSAWRSKASATTRCGWRRSGFNVPLHRTLAFTLAGFVAGDGRRRSTSGGTVRSIRTRSRSAPTIDLLIIAVIGGIGQLEGAWLGAFVFVVANNYLRDLPFADRIGLTEARFNTVVGLLVLADRRAVARRPDGHDPPIAQRRCRGLRQSRRPIERSARARRRRILANSS